MNKQQAKRVSDAIATLEQLIADVQSVHTELEEAYDSKSDRWKESDKGNEAEEIVGQLEDAISQLESANEALGNARGEL